MNQQVAPVRIYLLTPIKSTKGPVRRKLTTAPQDCHQEHICHVRITLNKLALAASHHPQAATSIITFATSSDPSEPQVDRYRPSPAHQDSTTNQEHRTNIKLTVHFLLHNRSFPLKPASLTTSRDTASTATRPMCTTDSTIRARHRQYGALTARAHSIRPISAGRGTRCTGRAESPCLTIGTRKKGSQTNKNLRSKTRNVTASSRQNNEDVTKQTKPMNTRTIKKKIDETHQPSARLHTP